MASRARKPRLKKRAARGTKKLARAIVSAVASKPKRRTIIKNRAKQSISASSLNPYAMPMKSVKVKAPAAKGNNIRIGAPRLGKGRSYVVKHTEYLDDLIGLAGWDISDPANQVYTLQPGLATEFPWLATIAANYEQYRWRKLIFHYKSRAPTSNSGAIYMATQLNVNDAIFVNKAAMFNYAGTTVNEVWTNMSHNCLLRRGDYLKKYFVRVGDLDVSSGQDLQMYDQGRFTLVPVSSPTGTQIGELLVEYEIEFFNPKANPNVVTNYAAEFEGLYGETDRTTFPTYVAIQNSLSPYQLWDSFPSSGAISQVNIGNDVKYGAITYGGLRFNGGTNHLTFSMHQAGGPTLAFNETIVYNTVRAGSVPHASWIVGVTNSSIMSFVLSGYIIYSVYIWFDGDVTVFWSVTSTGSFGVNKANISQSADQISNSWWNTSGDPGPSSTKYPKHYPRQVKFRDLSAGPVVERIAPSMLRIHAHKTHDQKQIEQAKIYFLEREEKERKIALPSGIDQEIRGNAGESRRLVVDRPESRLVEIPPDSSDEEPVVVPNDKKSKRSGFKSRKEAE